MQMVDINKLIKCTNFWHLVDEKWIHVGGVEKLQEKVLHVNTCQKSLNKNELKERHQNSLFSGLV